MFEIAISQMMTPRWELAREVDQVARHGFDAISVWRPKVSDVGVDEAAAKIASAGLRVASVQWAGGFTGGDGRSFDDSVADALEAIEMAEGLGAATVVVHSGCRGGTPVRMHAGCSGRRWKCSPRRLAGPGSCSRSSQCSLPLPRAAVSLSGWRRRWMSSSSSTTLASA